MMERLISITDFVLEIDKKYSANINQWYRCLKYANFLKQPLTLGMFFPVSMHGNLLNEPINYSAYEVGMSGKDFSFNFIDCKEYQEAKDRVLFEGFEYINKWYDTHLIAKNKITGEGQFKLSDFKTIEDLVKYNLELTTTTKKQIGL